MRLHDIIGKTLYYKSRITGCFTKFKVKKAKTRVSFVTNKLYGDVILISENGQKYNLTKDTILLEPTNY